MISPAADSKIVGLYIRNTHGKTEKRTVRRETEMHRGGAHKHTDHKNIDFFKTEDNLNMNTAQEMSMTAN